MSRKPFAVELREALSPLLPSHARYREGSGESWSVTWSATSFVWTVTVSKGSLSFPRVHIASDANENHGIVRKAELEIPKVEQVLAVMTGLGALPYTVEEREVAES